MSVAAPLVVVPTLLVKTAWYSLPSLAAETVKLSVVEVAPLMSLNVWPPSLLNCHCTVAAGLPLAEAVKVAVCPDVTDWLLGLPVMLGAKSTVSVAGLVIAVPMLLVKTAWYSLPSSATVAVKLSVVAVAPVMLLKVLPPSVLICHCTVAAGLPLADAKKLAVCPAIVV